ncbi:MAG: tetratricopeptide repeat protein [Candidatus Wallbacteria bacterium]
MKEIFIIKKDEETFFKECKNKTIIVPADQIYHDCLYIGCLNNDKTKLKYLAKVLDVQFVDETTTKSDVKNEESNDSSESENIAEKKETVNEIDKDFYCLKIKTSGVMTIDSEINVSKNADMCYYITFEELFNKTVNKKSIINNQKKMTKKELTLIVGRYLEQGINYSMNQKLDDAQEIFNLALDIDEKNYLVYFYLGNVYVDKAKFDIALYYYKKSIEINPKFNHSYNYLGLAYSYLSKTSKSVECWEKALELNEKDEFALTNLSKAYIQQKRYQEALEKLNLAKQINSSNLFVYNLIGVANANIGNLEQAIENWSKIIESGQDDEYLHLNLARAYFESGKYKEALEEYELLLEMFPKGHELNELAEKNIELLREKISEKTVVINEIKDISPYFQKKFGIALPDVDESLTKIINFNKLADYIQLFSLNSLDLKAIVFDKTNDTDVINYEPESKTLKLSLGAFKTTLKLRKSLRKAKTMIPVKPESDVNTNTEEKSAEESEKIQIRQINQSNENAKATIEELQDAINNAKDAIMADPKNEWAHYGLGSLYAQANSFKEAAEEFRIASEINSNNSIAWYALGLSYARLGKFDESIQALQQAIISVPDSRLTNVFDEWNYKDSLAYFGLGDVYIRKGMFDEAIQIFQKGLLIDATSALAHFQLGTCYEVKGQFDLAIESFINCISLNPNFHYAYSKLGIVYYKKELYNEALVMLLKAVSYENPDSESYYYLGEVYNSLGKVEEAKYAFNMVLQIAPKDDMYYTKAQKIISSLIKK